MDAFKRHILAVLDKHDPKMGFRYYTHNTGDDIDAILEAVATEIAEPVKVLVRAAGELYREAVEVHCEGEDVPIELWDALGTALAPFEGE